MTEGSTADAPTAEVPTAERLVFVSDLHLAPPGRPQSGQCHQMLESQALADFVRHVGDSRTAGERTTLVLLGDVFDISASASRRGESAVVAALEAIIAAHPHVFAALRAIVNDGVSVCIVSGNHDIDLGRPRCQHVLRNVIRHADCSHSGLTFAPWCFHVPHVVFAEHGSQHSPLHRSPRVWLPYELAPPGDDEPRPLLTTRLAMLDATRRWIWRPRRFGELVRIARRLHPRDADYHAIETQEMATALPGPVLRQLDAVSRVSWWATSSRVALSITRRSWARVARRGTPARSARALLDAWPRTAAILDKTSPVAVCVYGHSHVPDLRRNPECSTVYANCGTWVGVDGDFDGVAPRRSVIVVRSGGGPTAVMLARWDADARCLTPIRALQVARHTR